MNASEVNKRRRLSARWMPWLMRLVGPAILAILLRSVHVGRIVALAHRAHVGWLLLAVPLNALGVAAGAARWQSLIAGRRRPTAWRLLGYRAAGNLFGSITPGKLGDLVRGVYLVRDGVRASPAALSLVLDRAFDLAFLAAAAAVAAAAFGARLGRFRGLLEAEAALTLLVVCAVAMVGLRRRTAVAQWLARQVARLETRLGCRLHLPAAPNAETPAAGLRPWLAMGWTIAAWSVWIGTLDLMAAAIGVHLPVTVLAAAVVLASLASVFPLTIAGIGARDALFLELLPGLGVSREAALLFSFCFVYLYLVNAGLGLVAYWLVPLQP